MRPEIQEHDCVLAPVRRILQEAVEEGRLAANPAAGIGRSVLPRNERPFEGKVYTPTQVQQLLQVCKVKLPERYPLLFCLVQTGLRLGEALALEWSDVDWSSGTLTIRGTLFQGEKGLPKNGRFHHLTMTPPLRACFESVYLQRQVERNDGPGQLPAGSSVARRARRSMGTISGTAGGSRSLKPRSSRQSGYTTSAGPWCPCSSMRASRRGKSRAILGIGRS